MKPNPIRAKIAALFADGRERKVVDVATKLGMNDRSGVTQIRGHMTQMRTMGLLASETHTGSMIAIWRASPKEAKERFLRAQGPNCTDIVVKKP